MVVLQTASQAAHVARSPLFTAFIDLKKAYDGLDRGALFSALADELGVADGTVATLSRMYTSV